MNASGTVRAGPAATMRLSPPSSATASPGLPNNPGTALPWTFGSARLVVLLLMVLSTRTAHGLGQTVLEAGLWMAPGGRAMVAFTPVSSRLLRTVGPRVTLVIGAAMLALGYLFTFTFEPSRGS